MESDKYLTQRPVFPVESNFTMDNQASYLHAARMKLRQAFYRLPLRFDGRQLELEVQQFAESDWRPHPQGHPGNSALPLLSVAGDPDNNDVKGPMQPTPFLARCPYIKQVLAALDVPIGRTRLMRIAGHRDATAHVDTNYYWSQRVRVHIPIITRPGVRFMCGGETAFMDVGECWIFDTWRTHNVTNPDDQPRVHLVVDTVGSESFWQLVNQPHDKSPRHVEFDRAHDVAVSTERRNFALVMHPAELQILVNNLLTDLQPASAQATDLSAFENMLARFLKSWQAIWSEWAEGREGWQRYASALAQLETELQPFRGKFKLDNDIDGAQVVTDWILKAAFNPTLAPQTPLQSSPSRFDRPLFIVAAPRSGSSLLFESLSAATRVYTVGGESHAIFENIAELSPEQRGFSSNQLSAQDATTSVINLLQASFLAELRDRDGHQPPPDERVRMLEKTPKNALRIPFLAAAFPDALFVYLYREPHEGIASIIEAWQSERFVTYRNLPDWSGLAWSLLLIPDWQKLQGHSVAEIAAAQWETANRYILNDLNALPASRWYALTYSQFLDNPRQELQRIADFAQLPDVHMAHDTLPLSRHTLTPPSPDKWRKHAEALEQVLPLTHETALRARQACGAARALNRPRSPAPAAPAMSMAPLRSVHTTTFPMVLRELGMSLFVSTYQAGKLVLLRAEGDVLNTHFSNFRKPMGVAFDGNVLAVGCQAEVCVFANVPAVAAKQKEPPLDACFLPRFSSVTGNIQIHDLAWAGRVLWYVNTSFSSLCTLSLEHSFVPHWRPHFISALAPEDRCHLNGLAVMDGQPAFVTALGQSDVPGGWRDHKKDGGLVMHVPSNEIILRGLSMPHSPRYHNGKLWVLDSGNGGFGVVDIQRGHYQEITRLPGFTRGLDFWGRYAFIGLSQVRESAVFSDIAVAKLPLEQRASGVWVVDTISGDIIAFTRFEDQVQEIFAVTAVGFTFPDVITNNGEIIENAFVLPDAALAAVPANLMQT